MSASFVVVEPMRGRCSVHRRSDIAAELSIEPAVLAAILHVCDEISAADKVPLLVRCSCGHVHVEPLSYAGVA